MGGRNAPTAAREEAIRRFRTARDRMRQAYEATRRFCQDPDLWSRQDHARPLCDYYTAELPLALADEEEALMPLLARRLHGDPCFDEIALRIAIEHERDRKLGLEFLRDLQRLALGGRLGHSLRFSMRGIALANTGQAHLDYEERQVLPLAERILSDDDLAMLLAASRRRYDAAPASVQRVLAAQPPR